MLRTRFLAAALTVTSALAIAQPACAQYSSPYQSPYQPQMSATPDADALAASMRQLAVNPRDLNALIAAGELSLKVGDASGAAALFKRAEQVDPMNGRVKAGMGRILVTQERPGEALRYFDQAVGYGLDPRTFAGDRGLAYDLIGQQERAQRDYRMALKSADNAEVRRRYALSLGISGRQDAALAEIDTLLRRNDRGAWRARAFILAMTGDLTGATGIATRMMPPGMAYGLQPFFVRLPSLPAIDKAFAVHFGEVRPTPERLADARLIPPLPVLGPDPDARVQVAAAAPLVVDPRSRRDRRRRGALPQVAVASTAPKVAALPAAPGFGTFGNTPTDPVRTAAFGSVPARPVTTAPARTAASVGPAPVGTAWSVAPQPARASGSFAPVAPARVAIARADTRPLGGAPALAQAAFAPIVTRPAPRVELPAAAAPTQAAFATAQPAVAPTQIATAPAQAAVPTRIAPAQSQFAPSGSQVASAPTQFASAPSQVAPRPVQVSSATPQFGPGPAQAAPVATQVSPSPTQPAPAQVATAITQPTPAPLQVASAPAQTAFAPPGTASALGGPPSAAPSGLAPGAVQTPGGSSPATAPAPVPAVVVAVASPVPANAQPLPGVSPPPAAQAVATSTLPSAPALASSTPTPLRASEDTILARIVAGLTVPGYELGVGTPPPAAPAATPSDPAPVAAAVAQAPKPVPPTTPAAKPVALAARPKPTPSEPAAVPAKPPAAVAARATASRRRGAAEAVDAEPTPAARRGRTKPVELAEAAPAKRGAKASAPGDVEDAASSRGRTARGRATDDTRSAKDDGDSRDTRARSKDRRAVAAADDDAPAKKGATARTATPRRDDAKAEKADEPRIWVQVAGGANESDLPKAWSNAQSRAPALKGRTAYATPLRATNRVVTGPFKTDAEARAFVNQLAKQGVSAFPFTSDKGQKLAKLPPQ